MAGLRLLIFLFTAIPLLTVEAAAQDYRSWDRNRDGVIARSEWRGTLQDFRDRDTNRDGVLSGNELRLQWEDDDLTDFDLLDGDGSGRIERPEWRGTRPAFNRLDRNRDGVLSRREFVADAVAASADPIEDTLFVDSRQEWTDTGMFVNAGDVVTFRAQGTIQMTTGADDRATPAGSLTGRTARNSPRPDQRAGTLLVRVGNAIEAAGPNGTFRARNSGPLYLGVNDDHFEDNSGEYRVMLSIGPR
jgi:EF hand